MSASYVTRALVLTKHPYTKWAQFYTLYTQEYGKMRVLCRGANKITSKLSTHLEPLSISDICFVRGRKHIQLIGSRKVITFNGIFSDYEKLNYACYCLELINTLVKYEDPDLALYQLIEQSLYVLDYAQSEYDVVSSYFGFLLLSLLGFMPELDSCTLCNKREQSQLTHFSIKDGGTVCYVCNQSVEQRLLLRIHTEEVAMLKTIVDRHFEAFQVNDSEYKRLVPLLKQFVRFYTEKKLKTTALVNI